MNIYDSVWSFMIFFDIVWLLCLNMTLYQALFLCIHFYDFVWLWMTLYKQWACLNVYDDIWLCMTMYGYIILADQSLCNKRGSGKRWIRNFVTYVRLVHIQSWTSSEGHFWKTSSEKPSEGSCIFRAERGRSLYKPNSDFKVVGIGVKGGGGSFG